MIGIFSFFGNDLFSSLFNVHVPWIVFALVMLAVNALLTYFDINLAAKVLGVFLVTEIVMLALMAFSVLFTGGGPQGWSWGSLNPLNGFHSLSGVVTGATGPRSPSPAPRVSACSSRSGPGSVSSPAPCTARSRVTRRRSSRSPW